MEIALLVVFICAAWFWLDTISAREIAIEAGSAAAEREGLQFLDESVAVIRLWAARDSMGRLRLQRTYAFEVSDTGSDRLACSLVMLGKRVQSIEIPPHRDSNVIRLY